MSIGSFEQSVRGSARNQGNMRHFIWIYIRQQKRYILTCLLFCVIFSAIFILYQLPRSGIMYPLLLCMVAGLVIMGIDLAAAYRRYAALRQILDTVGLELYQELWPGKESAYSQGGKGTAGGRLRTANGERSAEERLQSAGGEESIQEHFQTGEGCAWELLQEMLYGQGEINSEGCGWEARVYREMVRQLLLEQRRWQDIMRIRHQDTVDYYTTWVHQIKTPIAAMGLVLQQEDTEDSRRLSEELQRIEQYVDMVLTYLRLGSRETDYVFAQVDLDKLLRGCIRKYAGQFIRRHLALDYQNINCQVLTDEKWLAFVVEQVLSNALKYTREGSVSIYLESPCTLCIRDTGIGIAPEDLPRIFEKGYTGYNGRSEKKTTGLGLYLCRQICDRLKSTIAAESVPGEGTVIRIGLGREVLEVE